MRVALRFARILAAVVATGLFAWLIAREVDFGGLASSVRDANPVYLAPVALVFGLRYLWRAMRWRVLVRHLNPDVAVRAALPRVVLSQAANMVLPFQLGYGLMVQISAEKFRIARMKLFGAEAVERMMDGLVFALFLVVAASALAVGSGFAGLTAFMVFGTTTGLVLAWLASSPEPGTRGLWKLRIVRRALEPRHVRAFLAGLAAVRVPGQAARIFGLSVAAWSTEAAMYWMVALSLGVDVNPLVFVFITAAANIGAGVPLLHSGVGFVFLCQQALLAVGEPAEVATTYAFLLEGLIVTPMILLGPIAAWAMRLSPRDLMPWRTRAEEGTAASIADAA